MSELTILVVGDDPARGRAALMTALASAALGNTVRMFFHEDAVRLLERAGDMTELVTEACAAGIGLIACQSGLAVNDLPFERLVEGIESGGLVSVLADGRDDRLVVF